MDSYQEFILITLLAFTVIGVYGFGSLYNRIKSRRIFKRSWSKIKGLGRRGELTSLGSSGFIIELEGKGEEVRGITFSVVLEKREFPINWIIDRLRGKKDTVTLTIHYTKDLGAFIDIFRPRNYYGDRLLSRYGSNAKSVKMNIYIYSKGTAGETRINKLVRLFNTYKDLWWVNVDGKGRTIMIIGGLNLIKDIDDILSTIMRLY